MHRLIYITIALLCLLFSGTGCHKKGSAHTPDAAMVESSAMAADNRPDEVMEERASEVRQNRIIGKIEQVYDPEGKSKGQPCDAHPCDALVEVVAITRHGMNYHGQIEEGMKIRVHFYLTLDATNDIFPELNQHFPGLNVGDYFEADLFDDAFGEEGVFYIKQYQRKE